MQNPIETISNGLTGITEVDVLIIINVNDIESLINLYQTCHTFAIILETKEVLNTILTKNKLSYVKKIGKIYYRNYLTNTFGNLVREYDRTYATSRSINYFSPEDCAEMALKCQNEKLFYHYFNQELVTSHTVGGCDKIYKLNKLIQIGARNGSLLVFKNIINIIEPMTEIYWPHLYEEAILSEKCDMYNYVRERNENLKFCSENDIRVLSIVTNLDFFEYVIKDIIPENLVHLNASYSARLAHWDVMHKIISITNPNPDKLLVSIIKSPQPEYVHEFIQIYNPSLQRIGKVIRKSISWTNAQQKVTQRLLFDYSSHLTSRNFTSLFATAYKYCHKDIIDMLNALVERQGKTFSTMDLDYNLILENLLRHRLSNGYTISDISDIISKVPFDCDLNYNRLVISSILARDYDILVRIILITPEEYDLDIAKLIEMILNTFEASEYRSTGIVCDSEGKTCNAEKIKRTVSVCEKDYSQIRGFYHTKDGFVYKPEEIIPENAFEEATSLIKDTLEYLDYEPDYNEMLCKCCWYENCMDQLFILFTLIPDRYEINYSKLFEHCLERYMFGPNYIGIECILLDAQDRCNVNYESMINCAIKHENFKTLGLIYKYIPHGHVNCLNLEDFDHDILFWKGNKNDRHPRNRKNARVKRVTSVPNKNIEIHNQRRTARLITKTRNHLRTLYSRY
jgi:hypothetical protein